MFAALILATAFQIHPVPVRQTEISAYSVNGSLPVSIPTQRRFPFGNEPAEPCNEGSYIEQFLLWHSKKREEKALREAFMDSKEQTKLRMLNRHRQILLPRRG